MKTILGLTTVLFLATASPASVALDGDDAGATMHGWHSAPQFGV